jgi:hypothetical protein
MGECHHHTTQMRKEETQLSSLLHEHSVDLEAQLYINIAIANGLDFEHFAALCNSIKFPINRRKDLTGITGRALCREAFWGK